MKRPRQHVMEDESEQLLRASLPSSWIIRPIAKDYGVDYEIEIVDADVVSGNRIWIQMKAVTEARICSKDYPIPEEFDEFRSELDKNGRGVITTEFVSFPLHVKELSYSLRCAFPLLLLVADLKNEEIYWLPLRDMIYGDLNVENPKWDQRSKATVHIPTWNRLSLERENNFPSLRWYALEPARMYSFATLHSYFDKYQHEFDLLVNAVCKFPFTLAVVARTGVGGCPAPC